MLIEQVHVPERLTDPDAGPFIELAGLGNTVEIETLGTDVITPDETLLRAQYANNPHRHRLHFAVRRDGSMIGRAMVTTRPGRLEAGAHLTVEVLPQHRGEGVGAALLDVAEQAAAAAGCKALKVNIAHSAIDGGERVEPPTGFGDLPAADPGVRFLLAHGYSLEQVDRISLLEVPNFATQPTISDEETVREVAKFEESDGYEVVTWVGATPEEHLDDLALLRTRMSTDAPEAGLASGEDPWDAARVVDHDQRMVAGGQVMLTAAARHQESGRLVGFSELAVAAGDRAARQEDTLVLREHRGHRLGALTKSATLALLREHAPHVDAIVTWNAEENRPMLDVNEQMGFRAIGYEGGWLKRAE